MLNMGYNKIGGEVLEFAGKSEIYSRHNNNIYVRLYKIHTIVHDEQGWAIGVQAIMQSSANLY